MISNTNYVELITVNNGLPSSVKCGSCQIPGSGTWLLTGDGWFNSRKTFGPGQYRLTYLGGTKIQKQTCKSAGDFSWHTTRVAEPICSSIKVDLSKWIGYTYKFDDANQHAARPVQWQLTANGVTELYNGEVAFFGSDFTVIDQTMQVTCKVGNPLNGNKPDDDQFGVAWGLSIDPTSGKPDHYYVIQWKSDDYDGGHKGFQLMRVVNSGNQTGVQMFNRLYQGDSWTDGQTQIAILARSPAISWQFNVPYVFQITYRSDGMSIIKVLGPNNSIIWQTTYTDPEPLGAGKVAFYNISQENTSYQIALNNSLTQVIYDSPPGSICASGKTTVQFQGASDDVVILYHADDVISIDYDGVPGDPYTINLPAHCILFADTGGYLIGSAGVPNAPTTAQKTFIAGSGSGAITHTIPLGTALNKGTGHVSDFIASGFTVKQWGENINVSDLAKWGWVEGDGLIRFSMALVPCGVGDVMVKGVTTGGQVILPALLSPIWKMTEEVGGVSTQIMDAPSVVDQSIEFTVANSCQIGVQLVQTPSDLTNPQFKLENLATIITNPRRVVWTEINPGGRYLSYDFEIHIGSNVFTTQSDSDVGYFLIDGQQWGTGNKEMLPLDQLSIIFNLPLDTSETVATVIPIINGVASTGRSVKIVPRTVTRYPVTFHRDLVDSYIPNLTVKVAAQRNGLNTNNYVPYLYMDSNLILTSWDTMLLNSYVVVCIAKDVVTSPQQITYHLRTTKGILPHRYVQGN